MFNLVLVLCNEFLGRRYTWWLSESVGILQEADVQAHRDFAQ